MKLTIKKEIRKMDNEKSRPLEKKGTIKNGPLEKKMDH